MYNRYIPQSDGSYRKNRIPERPSPPERPPSPPCRPDADAPPLHPSPRPEPGGVTDFFRRLLPKDFDTGDLLIVLLLLLMAADNAEEQNTALLTLAQRTDGGISPQLLEKIKSSQSATPADAALRNALAGAAINQLATNPSNPDATDTYFSHEVPSAGVTDQKSSGRCWLFTGMNVMRARMIKDYNLGAF